MDWNPSDYVVHNDEQTRRHTEGVTSPAPVRHSVMQFHLDSQSGIIKLKPDQSEDPWPNGTPRRQVDVCGSQTVPDILVDANMDRGGNPVPKPAPSEPCRASDVSGTQPLAERSEGKRRWESSAEVGTVGACRAFDVSGKQPRANTSDAG